MILPGASLVVQPKVGKIRWLEHPWQNTIRHLPSENPWFGSDLQGGSLACASLLTLGGSGALSTRYLPRKWSMKPCVPWLERWTSFLILEFVPRIHCSDLLFKTIMGLVQLIDSGAECVRDISVLLNYFEINHWCDAGPPPSAFLHNSQQQRVCTNWWRMAEKVHVEVANYVINYEYK